MKGLFSIVVLSVCVLFALLSQSCSAQCVDCPSVVVSEYQYAPAVQVQYFPAAINWDQECAIQSAQIFQQCRTNGGNRWACLAQAGLNYWTCSGSTFETSGQRGGRLRAVATGFRAVRAAR